MTAMDRDGGVCGDVAHTGLSAVLGHRGVPGRVLVD